MTSFKAGQQVRYSDREDTRGTISAVSPDGRVRITWLQQGRAQPRLRYWYSAADAARFLQKPS